MDASAAFAKSKGWELHKPGPNVRHYSAKLDAVDDAETALRSLGNVASNEQTAILALMLMPGRD